MKLVTSITLGLITSTSLFANTTMCFKENHPSMTTIESTPLDGGECKSTKSVDDMKKDGWEVSDIKIEPSKNGKNYIYILKKESMNSSLSEEELTNKIMQKLQDRKEEEQLAKKVEIKNVMSQNGKNIYINQCQKCHGENANKKAYGTSRALIDLPLSDFQQSIKDYTLGEYDRGMAMIMRPYAMNLNSSKIKEVYSYIQSLKNNKDVK